jgi:hypothetical protein
MRVDHFEFEGLERETTLHPLRSEIGFSRDYKGRNRVIEAGKELRVFVVDDEEIIASSLAMILRLRGGIHATSSLILIGHSRLPSLKRPTSSSRT